MPDHRKHRGPHPEDHRLFTEAMIPELISAAKDYCWLLSRKYAGTAALKLVGDHFNLTQRQRMAITRFSCSDSAMRTRRSRRILPEELHHQPLLIDGYNLITTIEAALGHGLILPGRDDTFRDLASMHGTYRKVTETLPALKLIGETLSDFGISTVRWYLDRPVSNSGRLKIIMQDFAAEQVWNWTVELVNNPDTVLREAKQEHIVTADSGILDDCGAWLNLAAEIVTRHVPDAWKVDLRWE